mgnify:CR=1 FL=1
MSRYIVFYKSTCPFCVKAKELLEEKGCEYSLIEVGGSASSPWTQVKEAFRWQTVPMILEAESDVVFHFIGGYTDLVEYLQVEEEPEVIASDVVDDEVQG